MRSWSAAGLLVLILGLVWGICAAQQRAKRLILKDGSYQSATKWEVQGDRVHFMSADRYEWEDIPSSLIDWDATKKYNDSLDQPDSDVKAVTEEDAKEKAAEEAASPAVAPGLRLPDSGGVLMTNSGKFAHYATPNTGFATVYGSLADCVASALSGRVTRDERLWS